MYVYRILFVFTVFWGSLHIYSFIGLLVLETNCQISTQKDYNHLYLLLVLQEEAIIKSFTLTI